ncbi:MAG: hypothetical protein P1V35_14045 [Planctomycetota bacterium]|nr:hypothetical protein [Planctomycetota bacterium]
MYNVQRVVLLVLALVLGSCVSGRAPADSLGGICVLMPGGSVEWGFEDGGSWSLSLEGEDGLLRVDGATVHLVGVARSGTLEFRHSTGPADWRLEIWGGGWVCTRDRIHAPKGEYLLGPGTELSLDVLGNLLEDTKP